MRARLFFVRSPRAGRVKTRLARGVGRECACALYRAFGIDMLDAVLLDCGKTDAPDPVLVQPRIHVFFHPHEEEALVRQWLGPGAAYMPQEGDGLGPRMASAFARVFGAGDGEHTRQPGQRTAFSEYRSVPPGAARSLHPADTAILTGSDIPALRPQHIAHAEELLRTHDAVLGPAEDGGYYLIGFRREGFCPEALTRVFLGGEDVLERTLAILHGAGRTVALTETLPDVDTVEELADQLRRGLLEGTRTAELARKILGERGME